MSFGMVNQTGVSLKNITDITNVTSVPELFINVNRMIYGGWFYFILMITFCIILYMIFQQYKDQPLVNVMYSTGAISILSILMRAVNVTQDGVVNGLLTDFQMWVFPVACVIFVWINWVTKP